jgi:hypothetical protein|tara:strand:+ start:1919 stop:2722 length:804 start_codon:yes stop_codon:yes gene_type:complete
MRLIKAQNTNLRNIYGNGIKFDINDQVIFDTTNSILVPKGTTAQRPTSPVNGHLRFNTTDSRFEIYENSKWDGLRVAAPSTNAAITQQNIGSGDGTDKIFGPLASGDAFYPVPAAAQNVLVLVENVFQISGTNYTLVQNPGAVNTITSIVSTGASTVIQTATAHGYTVNDLIYVTEVESTIDDAVENLNTDDSSSPGSHTILSIPSTTRIEIAVDTAGGNTANYVGSSGEIYKAGSSTGPYLPGWYIQFTSAPDLDKPITVLHNFDK